MNRIKELKALAETAGFTEVEFNRAIMRGAEELFRDLSKQARSGSRTQNNLDRIGMAIGEVDATITFPSEQVAGGAA